MTINFDELLGPTRWVADVLSHRDLDDGRRPTLTGIVNPGGPRDIKLNLNEIRLGLDEIHQTRTHPRDVYIQVIHKALSLGYTWPPDYDNPRQPEDCLRLHDDGYGNKRILPINPSHYDLTPGEELGVEFLFPNQKVQEKDMQTEKALNLLDESYKTIKVVFDAPYKAVLLRGSDKATEIIEDVGCKKHTYKAPKDYKVEAGDLVVVIVSGATKAALCVSVDDEPDASGDTGYCWICGSLNLEMYDSCIKRDKELRRIILAGEKKRQADKMREFMKESLGFDSAENLKLPEIKVDEKA